MTDKTLGSNVELLDNIKIYVYNNRENRWNINPWVPRIIHCDFEISIISAIKQVYPLHWNKIVLMAFIP